MAGTSANVIHRSEREDLLDNRQCMVTTLKRPVPAKRKRGSDVSSVL